MGLRLYSENPVNSINSGSDNCLKQAFHTKSPAFSRPPLDNFE